MFMNIRDVGMVLEPTRMYYDSLISVSAFSFDAVNHGIRRQRYLYIMHSFKSLSKLALSSLRLFCSRVTIGMTMSIDAHALHRTLILCNIAQLIMFYNNDRRLPYCRINAGSGIELYNNSVYTILTHLYIYGRLVRLYVLGIVYSTRSARSSGLASMPSRHKQLTVLRSVHTDKKSREQFKRRWLRKIRTLPRYLATFSCIYTAIEVSPGVSVGVRRKVTRQIDTSSWGTLLYRGGRYVRY